MVAPSGPHAPARPRGPGARPARPALIFKKGPPESPAAPESYCFLIKAYVTQPLARAYSAAQLSTKAETTAAQFSSVWSAA